MRTHPFCALVALCCAVTLSQGAEPSKSLNCGAVPGFQSFAEIQPSPGNIYTLYVTFVGKKPSSAQLDKALRHCAAVASKADGSKDILVTAWFRKRPQDSKYDDDQLNPYGTLKYLAYTAADKRIGVHTAQLEKK